MSRPYLAELHTARTRRVAAIVALAAAGGSFGIVAPAEADVMSADTDTTCLAMVALAEGDPCLVVDEGDEGEESSYRVCHATGDPAHPWQEMTFESGGDQNRWLEEHPDDYDPEKEPHEKYGEECPPDPEQPEEPNEEEPPVVVKEQPRAQVQQQPQAQPPVAAPQAQSAPSLNVARSCASRRNFRIRVRTRKADPVVRAIVRVNGKKVRVVRGKRLTAPVRLTGLPKGRYSVTITARTREGRKLSGVRRYFTCTPKRAKRTVPQL